MKWLILDFWPRLVTLGFGRKREGEYWHGKRLSGVEAKRLYGFCLEVLRTGFEISEFKGKKKGGRVGNAVFQMEVLSCSWKSVAFLVFFKGHSSLWCLAEIEDLNLDVHG